MQLVPTGESLVKQCAASKPRRVFNLCQGELRVITSISSEEMGTLKILPINIMVASRIILIP